MSATNVDTERFCRLVCLTMQTGTKVLRNLFLLHVAADKYSIKQCFTKHKGKIISMKLFPAQLSLIFPPDKSDPDLQKFDITLLSRLLKTFFKPFSPNEMQLIHDLKEFRNGLNGHKGNAMADLDEFDRLWKEISSIIINLVKVSNDSNFEDEIKKEINSFLNDPLGLQETINMIMERFNRDAKLDSELSEILANQTEMIEMLKCIVQKVSSGDSDEVDGQVLELDQKSQIMNNLIDHTRVRVQSVLKENLVWTRQIQEAEDVINKNGVVTISGNPGEGKTSAGYFLLDKVTSSNLKRCLFLHDAKDWSFVDMGEVDVLFLDDIFGKHQLDESLLMTWSSVLSDLQLYVKEGKVKLIIALRQLVLAEFNSKRSLTFSWLPLLENKIELSSRHLNHDEKKKILISALSKHKRDLNELDIEKCVQTFEAPIGFPYCCSLFAADERLFIRREDFFLKPYRGIRDILNNMDRNKLSMLAYIFCSSDVHVDDLKCELTPSSKCLFQQICDAFLYHKEAPSRAKMYDLLKQLDGVYIVQEKGTYRFAHNILYESVGLELSERCPKLLLERCSVDFLCQCVQTGTDQSDETFVVTNRWYKDLCMRFIAEVTEQRNASRISVHHALLHPEFTRELMQILKKTGKEIQFLRGGGDDPTKSILAYFALRNVEQNHLVQSLLVPLNSLWYKIVPSWKHSFIITGLRLAYAAGNQQLVDVLLNCGTVVDASCLYASIFSRNSVLVDSVLQGLKETRTLDIQSISLSVEVVCVIGCIDTFQVILKQKPRLNPHHMIAATFGGNDDIIHIIANELCTKDGWDPLGIQILESFGYMLKKDCEGHDPGMNPVDICLKYHRSDAFTRYTKMSNMSQCMNCMALENSDVRTFIDYAETMQKMGWLKMLLEHSNFVYRSIPSLVLKFSVRYIKELVCFLKCMKQWNPNGEAVKLASEGVIQSGNEEMFQFLVDSGMTVNKRHYLLACQTGREEIIRCVTRNLPSTEV